MCVTPDMKKNLSLLLFTCLLVKFGLCQVNNLSIIPKAKLMVLGSYHMSNPNLDLANLQADDVRTPKRQKEMEELVQALARFKPTKIAVEVIYQSAWDTATQKNYQKYLRGEHQLDRREEEQVGFRLAKMLGHKNIYAIDEEGGLDFDKLMQAAQTYNQTSVIEWFTNTAQAYINELNKKMATSSLKQFLKDMNHTTSYEMAHNMYLQLLNIGKNKDYSGAELMADFYKRNLKITTNILKLKTSPEDRILVIYGNGHTSFFKTILFGSSDFEWVNCYDYL